MKSKKSIFYLFLLIIIYSIFALHDLGDYTIPKTSITAKDSPSLSFTYKEKINSFSLYNGYFTGYVITITGKKNQTSNWEFITEASIDSSFSWITISLPSFYSILQLSIDNKNAVILEMVSANQQQELIIPINSFNYSSLFDEQNLYPAISTFRDSTYFDETYYVRTIYEYLYQLPAYENTHPPMGKIIQTIGVLLFGFSPFGWRLIGTLFGILMIPIFYLFSKSIFQKEWLSCITATIFTFDFMHFTQTRLATIDTYVVFFILLMYYFMYRYYSGSFNELLYINTTCSAKQLFYCSYYKNTTLFPLLFCGFCMGMGISCKWTGVYAAIGLCILFFLHIIMFPYKTANSVQKKNLHQYISLTILLCILFFILLPILLYLLSYLPFIDYEQRNFFQKIWENQITMLHYHTTLTETHPYASPWYEWPGITRPLLLYNQTITDTMAEGISSFGNPLIWWTGILSFCYTLYQFIITKEKIACFLLIGFLSQYLPWIFIKRDTFIYHYFPCTIFLVLMIGYLFQKINTNIKTCRVKKCFHISIGIYTLFIFLLFLLFYPVLCGKPVERTFVEQYLRWLPEWVFVI